VKELDIAIRAAREAGAIVRSLYGTDFAVTEKGDRAESPLTEADTRSNETIERIVRGAFPDDGWLSEETKDTSERLAKRRVWIVDPLDGTREFVKHIPELAVAIALVEDGLPILGITFNPIRDELFAAARGEEATLNGEPMCVSPTSSLERATLLASRSEDARGEWDRFKDRFKVELTGSVAYKLALVASGRGDATFTLTPKHEWDVCSSVCLIEVAGGRVTDLAGAPIRFNLAQPKLGGMVASNGALHSALLELVAPST
jgi:myo-inositol-1(or 4)-monophosphatase